MSKPNITQEKLDEEIQNGKSYKEIAHEYGYGYPSRQLSEKIWKLGYKKRNKMSFYESGGANVSIKNDDVLEACKAHGIDPDTQEVFYETDVTDGKIEIVPKERKLVKQE